MLKNENRTNNYRNVYLSTLFFMMTTYYILYNGQFKKAFKKLKCNRAFEKNEKEKFTVVKCRFLIPILRTFQDVEVQQQKFPTVLDFQKLQNGKTL